MLLTAACSLDRFYTSADSLSSTLGFVSLNTEVFEYNDFKLQATTTPYKPNDKYWLFAVRTPPGGWLTAKMNQLIFLGQTNNYTAGETVGQNVTQYFSSHTKWGNPFYSQFFDESLYTILIHADLNQVKTYKPTETLSTKNFNALDKS